MFKNVETPADLLKLSTEYFSSFPKSEQELVEMFTKVKNVFVAEATNSHKMWEIYKKAASGDATPNEIGVANKIAQSLLSTTRFAAMLCVPGVVFVLPILIDAAKSVNIDIIPPAIRTEFAV